MAGFGEKLRREREKRKVSLDDIAAVTKIGTRSLKALEDENFSVLPGGIFNKSFVRAYARFLGMNEEAAVADYQAAVNEQPVSVETIAAQSAMAKASRLAAEQASESPNRSGLYRSAGFVLLSFCRRLYRVPRLSPRYRSMHSSVGLASTDEGAGAKSRCPHRHAHRGDGRTKPSTSRSRSRHRRLAVTQTAPAAPAEFTVSIKTSEQSWLSVTADGRRAFQRLFAPNEEQTVTAKDKIQIKIGNPNGTEISLNGKTLALGGDLDHPRTVTVDATGLANE